MWVYMYTLPPFFPFIQFTSLDLTYINTITIQDGSLWDGYGWDGYGKLYFEHYVGKLFDGYGYGRSVCL
jgi:hypothetical protein